MMRAACRIMVGVVLLQGSGAAATWAADESTVGDRVRVRTTGPEEPRVGILERATSSELFIRPSAADSLVEVRRSDVLKLEVSRGTRRNTLKGLVAGALAWGAIVGAVAAFDTLDESGVGEPLFIGGMLAAGAGVGSLVKTERWERLPVSGAAVGPGPRRGLHARVVVTF